MNDFLKGFLLGEEYANAPSSTWIEWKHISQGKTHCETCLKLDARWFARFNSPKNPLHPYCHCITMQIPYADVLNNADAESAYSKFVPFLFNTDGTRTHGKEKMLEDWGYTAEHALWLQREMEEQALYKYVTGEYKLGKLDKHGQHISIRIELERKNGTGTVSFISGWMVEASGKIRLATPYGGK